MGKFPETMLSSSPKVKTSNRPFKPMTELFTYLSEKMPVDTDYQSGSYLSLGKNRSFKQRAMERILGTRE